MSHEGLREILLLLFSKQRSETFLYFIDAEDATVATPLIFFCVPC